MSTIDLNIQFVPESTTAPFFPIATPIGKIHLEPLGERGGQIIYQWVKRPYAEFWGMGELSEAEVVDFYQSLDSNQNHHALLGYIDDQPAFLVELYNPRTDAVGQVYEPQPGDLGMHILIAPADKRIPNFTYHVFMYVMEYMFHLPVTQRIVVEPDHRNDKIHRLNQKAGFHHVKEVQFEMAGELKTALLAFCTREQFAASKRIAANQEQSELELDPAKAVDFVQGEAWEKVNRHLIAKSLAEFSHERILHPESLGSVQSGVYSIFSQSHQVRYHFTSRKLPLEHWLIDPQSLSKESAEGEPLPLDALNFIIEFNETLAIPEEKLPIYLEEISATLYGAAYKYKNRYISSSELANADFQTLEAAMTEGHPTFVANNGRIGYDAIDFRRYAPEMGAENRLIILAANRRKAHFASCDDLSYEQLMEQEFDISTRRRWNAILEDKGLNPEDYIPIPVHPWQWFNKLAHVFASEVAHQDLVVWGYTDDLYQAQQSIRTFYNKSDSRKFYVKTAISVLNMGFMRGLSARYMKATPAINQWLKELVDSDDTLQACNFKLLREIASVGYSIPYYEDPRMGNTPYKKMLAALWRESPMNQIQIGQNVMTMAALLHVDREGVSLVSELIKQSGLNAQQWIRHYLGVYLRPILHCFYKYRLVYMPHGENVILVMDEHIPTAMFMKDLGEEICLLNSDMQLPEDVQRIAVEVPDNFEILSIFTDIFDVFFRYLTAILDQDGLCPAETFWQLVADEVQAYQANHPEFAERYKAHDLFKPEFEHSCFNRLQLKNNLQMVNLVDPAEALQFSGMMPNPIAPYAQSAKKKKAFR